MHELSIALGIIDGTLQESVSRRATCIHAIHIKVGPLAGVDPDALAFAYSVAREGTPLEDCELVIHDAPLTLSCAKCQREQTLIDATHLRCPECGSTAESITGGADLQITALEIAA